MTNPRSTLIRTLAAGGLALIFFAAPTLAGDLSQQQIFESLTAHKTRAMTLTGREAEGGDHSALIEGLRRAGTRSLTMKERDEIAALASERPSVDLQIYFDFNSAAVAPQAVPQLSNLGNALVRPEFKGSLVTISGHTDAKGTDSYNQKLSERRAETIKRYLVDNFALSAENLVAVGYGKQQPKNAANLFAPENRRVQVINLAPQTQTQR
jgi:outer membrane protein OmpA-like peptidoglycan-associated protein